VHREGLDVVLTKDLLLAAVNVSQTNVDELLDADALVVLDPTEAVLLVFLGQTGQESDGHAVDVSTVRCLGSVDIGVCIDPDDGHLSASSFSDGLGCAGNGSNGNGVVTAESQDKAALASVLVDLLTELLGDGTDGARVLHAAIFGVFLGHDIGVLVDFTIVVHVELELFSQLFDETGLDQSHGSSIDTSLALLSVLGTPTSIQDFLFTHLASAETDGYKAQFVAGRQELGLKSWCVHCECGYGRNRAQMARRREKWV
jgi:hypothetical protein